MIGAYALSALLLAGAALADPGHGFATPDRRDLMVQIITHAGCKMSAMDAIAALAPRGFVPEETYLISRNLVEAGQARVENNELILLTEGCV